MIPLSMIQRRLQGFADADLEEFDVTIARFIVPRLRRFRTIAGAFTPPFGETHFTWWEKLDKMVEAFEELQKPLADPDVYRPGLKLFAEYLDELWFDPRMQEKKK